MERHIENIGCRAPYQKPHKDYPLCIGQKNLNASIYGYGRAKKILPKPCEIFVKVLMLDTFQPYRKGKTPWTYRVSLPKDITVITQSKEIDGHALIGNIGGYIGLILGKVKFVNFKSL